MWTPWILSLGSAPAIVVASRPYHAGAGLLGFVNPKIGTAGVSPNQNGGMIPSVGVPFGMTRWTAQTRENFISQCPYNDLDAHIHGFQATHQPAIWMGESAQVVVTPGLGQVKPLFVDRAHAFSKYDERSTPYIYEVTIDARAISAGHNATESTNSPVPGGQQPVPESVRNGANGRSRRDLLNVNSADVPLTTDTVSTDKITCAMTATSHVGHLRFDFEPSSTDPHVFIQATRTNWTGHVQIDPSRNEVSGSNPQRQDYALGPSRAPNFRGFFVSHFSPPFASFGIAKGPLVTEGVNQATGDALGAYVKFPCGTQRVEVRTAVSFVSVEQARRNLELEAPRLLAFEDAVEVSKQAWLDKIGRVTIQGFNQTDSDHDPRVIWYTGLFHSLQYPNDFSEPLDSSGKNTTFYSGYTDSVHRSNGSYYQSWSIWDTFRAETSLLTIFAPERVNDMMQSLLKIFEWSGRLPMWANVVETNIMVGTHVDAVFANALSRGFRGFDLRSAWTAVGKNAFEPPVNDTQYLYYDREGYTPAEARAGLTTYGDLAKGYVSNDRWSESASRTLDYAFDDYAASVVAAYAGDTLNATFLQARAQNYRTLYNKHTGFMEARNDNGTWAGSDQGWTEGDQWVYTLNVMHDPEGLARLMGGKRKMRQFMDRYFGEGHNDQTNEPSHHAPYMYSAIGYPASTQKLVRDIAWPNYNCTSSGLSGNEDLGQTSAWYIFSAMGFYPVNPADDTYIVGSPFFEKMEIRMPAGAATGGVGGKEHNLTIVAPNAPLHPYVKSLKIDGVPVVRPILKHMDIVTANILEFEMSPTSQPWGSEIT